MKKIIIALLLITLSAPAVCMAEMVKYKLNGVEFSAPDYWNNNKEYAKKNTKIVLDSPVFGAANEASFVKIEVYENGKDDFVYNMLDLLINRQDEAKRLFKKEFIDRGDKIHSFTTSDIGTGKSNRLTGFAAIARRGQGTPYIMHKMYFFYDKPARICMVTYFSFGTTEETDIYKDDYAVILKSIKNVLPPKEKKKK